MTTPPPPRPAWRPSVPPRAPLELEADERTALPPPVNPPGLPPREPFTSSRTPLPPSAPPGRSPSALSVLQLRQLSERHERRARETDEQETQVRLLVVAAELAALAGDTARAEALLLSSREAGETHLAAESAAALAPQATSSVESPSEPPPAALATVRLLRTLLREAEQGASEAELQAAGNTSTSPALRAFAQLLAVRHLLGTAEGTTALRPERWTAYPAVAQAMERIVARRTADPSLAGSVDVALQAARLALTRGDLRAFQRALGPLEGEAHLGGAVAWLQAMVAAAAPDAPVPLLSIWSQLQDEASAGDLLPLLLVAALQRGSSGAAELPLLLGSDRAAELLPRADRLALVALQGAPAAALALATAATEEPSLLAETVASALGPQPCALTVGVSPESVHVQRLSLAIVFGDVPGASDAALLERSLPGADHPTIALLRLRELAVARGLGSVAEELLHWHTGLLRPDERGFLAAALARRYPDAAAPGRALEARHLWHERGELSLRLTSAGRPTADVADELLDLAASNPTSFHSQLLRLEAIMRLGPEASPALFDELAEDARLAAAALVLAELWRAKASPEPMPLAEIVGRRSALATDPAWAAIEGIREGLLLAQDGDARAASGKLESALALFPRDIALRELHERLAECSPGERAEWRRAIASDLDPWGESLLRWAAGWEARAAGLEEDAVQDFLVASLGPAGALGRCAAELVPATHEGIQQIVHELERSMPSAGPGRLGFMERILRLEEALTPARAGEWLAQIVEEAPSSAAHLGAWEAQLLLDGDLLAYTRGCRPIAKLLGGTEGATHAALASRIFLLTGTWAEAVELLEGLPSEPYDWASRVRAQESQRSGDERAAAENYARLAAHSSEPLVSSTLYLRAAEAWARAGNEEAATTCGRSAVEACPDHPVALATLAELEASTGNLRSAAEAYERLATHSRSKPTIAWRTAGQLWLEVPDHARALAALQRAAEGELDGELFQWLRKLMSELGREESLTALLERRQGQALSDSERAEVEDELGLRLAALGRWAVARPLLEATLQREPDHQGALQQLVRTLEALGEWPLLERQLRKLALLSEGDAQYEAWVRLAELQLHSLGALDRCERSCEELAELDLPATYRIRWESCQVQLLARRGGLTEALATQERRIREAAENEQKRQLTVELAQLQDEFANDPTQAEQTLERARRAWGIDAALLRGFASLYRRSGNGTALQLQLERAHADASRAIGNGRLETGYFEVLAAVAELSGQSQGARAAEEAAEFFSLQRPAAPSAALGLQGLSSECNDATAPPLVTLPLQALLRRFSTALERAYPLELEGNLPSLDLVEPELAELLGNARHSLNLPSLGLAFDSHLSVPMVPRGGDEPLLVAGPSLLRGTTAGQRHFLGLRCLKLVVEGVAAVARATPLDATLMLRALLMLCHQDAPLSDLDRRRTEPHVQRLRPHVSDALIRDGRPLVKELEQLLATKGAALLPQLNQWGSRAALLTLGSTVDALGALASLTGATEAELADGESRRRWLLRVPEARDLLLFAVSEERRSLLGR